MPSAPEIRPLTGLRAFAALLVVFFHFYRGHIPGSWPVVPAVVDAGFVAVGMFFVLSGFILTHVYDGRDLADPAARRGFWWARFARIYPVYFLSLVVAFLASFPETAADLTTVRGCIHLAHALPLLNAFSHYGMFYLNWAAWSLSAEAFFYLLFPWIAGRIARLKTPALFGIATLAWGAGLIAPAVYSALDPDHLGHPLRLGDEVLWSWYLKFFPLLHLASFVVGVVAGRLAIRYRAALARLTPGWRDLVVMAGAALLIATLCSRLVPYAYLFDDVLAPLFAVLLVALAAGDSRSARVLGSRLVVGLGRASYALYILHVPVFYVFLRFAPDMWDRADLFWPYLGVLVVVSIGVHRWVEEPARQGLKRWADVSNFSPSPVFSSHEPSGAPWSRPP